MNLRSTIPVLGRRRRLAGARRVTKAAFNYRRKLPHLQRPGYPLFLGFTTKRRGGLSSELRDVVLDVLLHQHKKMYRLHGCVVMPEHVHTLLTPLFEKDGKLWSIPEIAQNVKSVSAHQMNKALDLKGTVWQRECFDRIVRSRAEMARRLEYIQQNPVVAGLVQYSEDYRWVWFDPEPFWFSWS
jgi:REP element-mobilizing transposase RayT